MDIDLETLGHAAATYQRDPRIIRKALAALDIQPALILNDLEHFAAEDIARAIQSMALRAVVTQPVAPELPRVF